jgi:hypothetical protein
VISIGAANADSVWVDKLEITPPSNSNTLRDGTGRDAGETVPHQISFDKQDSRFAHREKGRPTATKSV